MFKNLHDLPYGTAPATMAEDRETIALAQKWADNENLPVYFVHWTGEVYKTIEPEV